ncbi:MAG: GIY-YIG nuclease family protein, partial [Campylobacterota bacterium]|nr:GIY-YIG nuclease family protein [Campylobacterota bacterium]
TRIKNAKNDPTYLMADVKIVEVFEVYNVNPHKLEQLIHRFFSNSCLDIDIIDNKDNIYNPREWFIVPLNIIEKAIELIINGKIINFKYDYKTESILQKKAN